MFLSTYPPRECGIATFTQDLLRYCQLYLGAETTCIVAALNFTALDTHKYTPEVEWQIDQTNKESYINLAKEINSREDISSLVIQHEYGIFGSEAGSNVLAFMEHCTKPMLVTLHTVLPEPKKLMFTITRSIIQRATTVVVLTDHSKQIIEALYPASHGKVFVIPHGIHNVAYSSSVQPKEVLDLSEHSIVSTFGFLSQGKGIEYVLHALKPVIETYPDLLYLILGETHPVIIRKEGEKYRKMLQSLITKLGLQKHVKFYDQYFDLPELFTFLQATDIYISTSINPHQAVSGTLSYALGAGRAVISTQFSQSKELVTEETGRLVAVKDSPAITAALMELLGDRELLTSMNKSAYQRTRYMLWENVAETYIRLVKRTTMPELDLSHLRNMTDQFGLFQFAKFSTPHTEEGYTIDDNARAAILCSWLLKSKQNKEVLNFMEIYMAYLVTSKIPGGTFTNYHDINKKATRQNHQENLEDSHARTLWALSEIMTNTVLEEAMRTTAQEMFLRELDAVPTFTFFRSQAFAIKAYALAQKILPEKKQLLRSLITEYADNLVAGYEKYSDETWKWFESHLAYSNGLLPESLLIAWRVLKTPVYKITALTSLNFLIQKTFIKGVYHPVGQSGWHNKNQEISLYDQQPEDPAAMILALDRAYQYTYAKKYKALRNTCFSWFLGVNSLQKPLYDETTGGCYDGLHPDRVNLNQGAESLLSYLMSHYIVTHSH